MKNYGLIERLRDYFDLPVGVIADADMLMEAEAMQAAAEQKRQEQEAQRARRG